MKKQVTDSNGHVFVTIDHDQKLGITRARWIGEQTDETVLLGAKAILEIVQQHNTSKLLNESSQVTGTWQQTYDLISGELVPEAVKAGLRYLAYVLPQSLEGKLFIVDLHQRVGDIIQIRVFTSAEVAEDWLESLG